MFETKIKNLDYFIVTFENLNIFILLYSKVSVWNEQILNQ